MPAFAHTWVHSAFSFLRGASLPETLVERARGLGFDALALTDRMSVSGAVRFQRRAEALGLRAVVGAELLLEDGEVLVALADGPKGYQNRGRIRTAAHLEGERTAPRVRWSHLETNAGLFFLLGGREGGFGRALLRRDETEAEARLAHLSAWVPKERLHLFVCRDALPGNSLLEAGTVAVARRHGIPILAAHPVEQAEREAFWVQDLLTCLRLGLPLETPHPERPLNAERYLKGPEEMAMLFADHREWLVAAGELLASCESPFRFQRRLYPAFPLPAGLEASAVLAEAVAAGARARYGRITPALKARLEHELATIRDLGFADYFLLVADVVRFARSRGIRVSGRGSAADSVVAYCLGLTEVDAFSRHLLFERFLSRERAERPDIDLDFDYRRRDEVARYVTERYGAEHVAAVATFQTFRARSAVRELGKVLGLPVEEVDRLARRLPAGLPADAVEEAWGRLPELRLHGDPARYRLLLRAAAELAGLPRHIGTHLGGIVIARTPLVEVAPRQRAAKGVEIIPFDKEDVEALGLVKLDLLSLRTLAVLEEAGGKREPEEDDPRTYRRIARGETIGVFQLESPAQRALQPRLEPRRLEDLVQAVAIIRPGPIKGDMVEPYLRRRRGEEAITYPHPRLVPILEKTYGVVLFQEQVIEIARTIAGFTPGEADQLRRVMTHARSERQMRAIGEEFVRRAVGTGVDHETATAIFRMLAGYASYGFPEAHAAAFAQLAYESARLAEHEPAAFFAALLSHQPLGYYPMHTLVTEARRRGVRFLPPDVTRSEAACTVEEGRIRIGLRLIIGVGGDAERIVAERKRGPFRSLRDMVRRLPLHRDVYEALCLAGACDAFSSNRRQLLAELAAGEGLFVPEGIPDFPEPERTWLRESVLPLAGPALLMRRLRPGLRRQGVLGTREARGHVGETVRVAGIPLHPHRPPTRSGRMVVFFSLEDEQGLLDVTMFEDRYQAFGQHLFGARRLPLLAEGRMESRQGALALRLEKLVPLVLRAKWEEPRQPV